MFPRLVIMTLNFTTSMSLIGRRVQCGWMYIGCKLCNAVRELISEINEDKLLYKKDDLADSVQIFTYTISVIFVTGCWIYT